MDGFDDPGLVRIAGAGHVPTITRPQEVVDAILQRFGPRSTAMLPPQQDG